MSFEQTIIQGNLGDAPVMRYTPDGTPVTNFSVAVGQGKDAQGNDRKAKWYKVTAWRAQAESCNTYLKKGSPVLVIGTVKASAWSDQEGNPRASLDLTANTVKFLGGGAVSGIPSAEGSARPPTQDGEDLPF
jgi:single-strand DNA-binding protein